jgi:hypothetical protein
VQPIALLFDIFAEVLTTVLAESVSGGMSIKNPEGKMTEKSNKIKFMLILLLYTKELDELFEVRFRTMHKSSILKTQSLIEFASEPRLCTKIRKYPNTWSW